MALDSDSYSSVADVVTMCRHLLDGNPTFDQTTRPTFDEVEDMIDDMSSDLNAAIAGFGITVPISTAGPKRDCDVWVRTKVAALAELTQRGTGFDGDEDSRYNAFWTLFPDAQTFVSERLEGWKEQGVTVAEASHTGLQFTGLDKHSKRSDPDSTTLEQPLFRRRQFNP